MHPILARGGRLALYLAVWALAGGLLASLVKGAGDLRWAGSIAIAMPLAVSYGFFCLSSWYVARSLPLAATGILRLTSTALTAALAGSLAWLALTRGWMQVVGGRGGEFDPQALFDRTRAMVFGFGVLLYLL